MLNKEILFYFVLIMKKVILMALLFAGGFLFISQWVNAQTTGNTNVKVSIVGGNIAIGATGSFNFWSFTSLDTEQVTGAQFTGDAYFRVKDLKGADAGYYTTLSISDLTWATVGNTDYIPATWVMIKVDSTATTKISGRTNANVLVDASLAAGYVVFDSSNVRDFIYRSTGVNSKKIGKYAAWPRLQITIPAFLTPDTYEGTITYTLYEN